MDLIGYSYTATDVLSVAKISHTDLQNWLRYGLLDRLGVPRPAEGWRRYSLLDVLTIAAEAQLAFLGIAPAARNDMKVAETIAARCMALLCRLPLDPVLRFTFPASMGVEITVNCQKLADDVLAALPTKEKT
jgi:hypothetical protein